MAVTVLTQIRVTDDELAAVAVAVGTPCPVPLTTVDENDQEALLAAVARGRRSLAARGVLHGDETAFGRLDAEWMDLLGSALRSAPALVLCAVDAESVPVDGVVQYLLRLPDPAELAMVTVLGGGLHDVVRVPREVALDLVTAVAEQAAADPDTAARLLLLSKPAGSFRSVVVGGGRVHLREAPDEDDVSSHAMDQGGVAAAFAWLELDTAAAAPYEGDPT